MITSTTELTVEKVEVELAELEAKFKTNRTTLVGSLRFIKSSCGATSQEARNEADNLFVLKENHTRHVRKLRALLAVLKEETGQKSPPAERPTVAPEPAEEEPKQR